jgi:hypothetical protein
MKGSKFSRLNLAEKIIGRHAGKRVQAGDIVEADVDVVICMM